MDSLFSLFVNHVVIIKYERKKQYAVNSVNSVNEHARPLPLPPTPNHPLPPNKLQHIFVTAYL